MCLQLTTVSTTVNIYEWDTGLNSLCYFIFTQSWDPCDSCFSEYQSRAQFAQGHTALNGRLIQTQQGTVAALKRQTALCQPSLSIFSLPQGNWLLWVLHNSGQEVLLTPLQRAPKAATHSHGTVHLTRDPGTIHCTFYVPAREYCHGKYQQPQPSLTDETWRWIRKFSVAQGREQSSCFFLSFSFSCYIQILTHLVLYFWDISRWRANYSEGRGGCQRPAGILRANSMKKVEKGPWMRVGMGRSYQQGWLAL